MLTLGSLILLLCFSVSHLFLFWSVFPIILWEDPDEAPSWVPKTWLISISICLISAFMFIGMFLIPFIRTNWDFVLF